MRGLAFVFLQSVAFTHVAATTYSIESFYDGTSCTGTPYLVNANEGANCVEEACRVNQTNASTSTSVGMSFVACASDYLSALRGKFGNSPYIIQVYFADSDCSTFGTASGFPASGNCEGSFNTNDTIGVHLVGTLEANGSATMEYYSGSPCLGSQYVLTESVDTETLENHSCDPRRYRWYSSNDVSSSSGGLSTGAIIGISIGGLALLLVVIGSYGVYKRRSRKLQQQGSLPLTTAILQSEDTTIVAAEVPSDRNLWNDDIIVAKRISRDKVKIKKLISRGGYGEVFAGVFNRKKVAVKMLVPATRGRLQQVNEFLAEAKMAAVMDHPHIVTLIGVAWDSLSDLCVVFEYMDGGDLRTLLDKYLASRRPVGFNRVKTTIALQVCHALTYLHSLSPPVVHRDLKSRNILLNRAMAAKLTDFGVSRERPDYTMTAGVGTSLWMAPEVMLGEKYDDKADMFSFGVVLSELDVHTLPYARTKKNEVDSRQMVDATLLQKITTGEARVEFSKSSSAAIEKLGRSCVSLDPSERPTASEALYKLHLFLRQTVN